MEVATGEVITRGLSMPHSPRWYGGRLWVLESGNGGFGCIDPATGEYEALTVLPGFTRGLDFCGPLAFIGLSQVRESAVFSGIAVAERPLEERCCGVWVVNIHTGQTVAFVKFEDAVQEIFALQVLPGVQHPDVINDRPRLIADSFVVPDEALADVVAARPGRAGLILPVSLRRLHRPVQAECVSFPWVRIRLCAMLSRAAVEIVTLSRTPRKHVRPSGRHSCFRGVGTA